MRQNKPVVVWDGFCGSFLKLYQNITEASKELGISAYTIKKYINSGSKHSRKYFSWYYYEDISAADDLMFPIVQKENDIIINQFRTVTEAADKIGLGRNVIARHIQNGTKDKWNCSWENLKKLL